MGSSSIIPMRRLEMLTMAVIIGTSIFRVVEN